MWIEAWVMRLEPGCRCQNLVGEPSPYSWGPKLGFLDALLPEAQVGEPQGSFIIYQTSSELQVS